MTLRLRGCSAVASSAVAVVVVASLAGCGGSARSTPATRDPFRLLIATRDALDAPGLTVREAATHLGSADAAFRFVRDDVEYISYPGSFAGPDGVLRTRIANSNDRAVLLAALLSAPGR